MLFSDFCYEHWRPQPRPVSFLSWLNILVPSLVRKLILAHQLVLQRMHLDGVSLSPSLSLPSCLSLPLALPHSLSLEKNQELKVLLVASYFHIHGVISFL